MAFLAIQNVAGLYFCSPKKRPLDAALFVYTERSTFFSGFPLGGFLARLHVGRMRNGVLIRGAECVDGLVMAPVGVEPIVFLDAFVNVLAHFFGPRTVLPFQKETFAPVRRPFGERRYACTRPGQYHGGEGP